jgi:hypothetical protein
MTINDERRWDEMIIFLGRELRRLKDRIEEWGGEEEGDFAKEIQKKLGLEKLDSKDLREIIDTRRQRKKFIQNLRGILKEAAEE